MISHRLALIDAATTSITVEMAYFTDRRFTAALARAVQRGVRVKLVTASETDVLANMNRVSCNALMRLTITYHDLFGQIHASQYDYLGDAGWRFHAFLPKIPYDLEALAHEYDRRNRAAQEALQQRLAEERAAQGQQ